MKEKICFLTVLIYCSCSPQIRQNGHCYKGAVSKVGVALLQYLALHFTGIENIKTALSINREAYLFTKSKKE